jgi:heptaprenyl diphosphate synthase
VITLASAIEILTCNPVHDDVIDSRVSQRAAYLHSVYGEKNAVIMGDYLFSRAFRLASDYAEKENALSIAQVVSRICEGEMHQNVRRYNASVSKREYLRRIMVKTALLFLLCCHIGAEESSCDPEVAMHLRMFGYNIGMGFQIIDDILDLTAREEVLGKPVGTDIREGYIPFPYLCDGERRWKPLTPPLAKATFPLFSAKNHQDIERCGGIERARKDAELYTVRALRECSLLPPCIFRDALEEAAKNLLSVAIDPVDPAGSMTGEKEELWNMYW